MYMQQSNNKMKYLETKLNLANPKPSVPCCNNVGLFFFYLTFFGGKKGRVLLYCSYSSPILPHSLNCVFKIAKLVHIPVYDHDRLSFGKPSACSIKQYIG